MCLSACMTYPIGTSVRRDNKQPISHLFYSNLWPPSDLLLGKRAILSHIAGLSMKTKGNFNIYSRIIGKNGSRRTTQYKYYILFLLASDCWMCCHFGVLHKEVCDSRYSASLGTLLRTHRSPYETFQLVLRILLKVNQLSYHQHIYGSYLLFNQFNLILWFLPLMAATLLQFIVNELVMTFAKFCAHLHTVYT